MALNIKNPEVEALAAEVAQLAGETRTEAVHRALLERKQRLAFRIASTDRGERVRRFLEREVWPHVMGSRPSLAEEDEMLGYGPGGV